MTYVVAIIMAIMVLGSVFIVIGILAKTLFDFLMWPFIELVKLFINR